MVGGRDPFRGLKQSLTCAFLDHAGRRLGEGTVLEARRPPGYLGLQQGNPMGSAHAWNLIGKKWGERCVDMGWRARERELTGPGWLSGDSARADKNSRRGPRRSWILYTGPSSLGPGRKKDRIRGVQLCKHELDWSSPGYHSSNSGQCDIFQTPPFDGDGVRMGQEGMGRGGLAGRGLWLLQQAGTWKGGHWPSWNPP